jgi:hypothetical protein
MTSASHASVSHAAMSLGSPLAGASRGRTWQRGLARKLPADRDKLRICILPGLSNQALALGWGASVDKGSGGTRREMRTNDRFLRSVSNNRFLRPPAVRPAHHPPPSAPPPPPPPAPPTTPAPPPPPPFPPRFPGEGPPEAPGRQPCPTAPHPQTGMWLAVAGLVTRATFGSTPELVRAPTTASCPRNRRRAPTRCLHARFPAPCRAYPPASCTAHTRTPGRTDALPCRPVLGRAGASMYSEPSRPLHPRPCRGA